jgi:hypothetical protein
MFHLVRCNEEPEIKGCFTNAKRDEPPAGGPEGLLCFRYSFTTATSSTERETC